MPGRLPRSAPSSSLVPSCTFHRKGRPRSAVAPFLWLFQRDAHLLAERLGKISHQVGCHIAATALHSTHHRLVHMGPLDQRPRPKPPPGSLVSEGKVGQLTR